MNYRIKTEKEFKREFGENWHKKVCCSWVKDMDFLFGRRLSETQNDILEHEGIVGISGWNISKDMATEIDCKKIGIYIEDNAITVTYNEYEATAKCHPKDEFDFNKGLAIALSRLARKLGEYEAEVEETIVVKRKAKKNILDEI